MTQLAQVLTTIAPVFGLILIGYAATRLRWLDPGAGPGMAQFIFTFAIPALLFRTMVTADFAHLDPLPVIATFLASISIVWIATTVLAHTLLGKTGTEAASLSFTAAFSNVLIVGLQLSLDAFGPAAAPPVLVIVAIDVPFMWLVATVQASIANRATGGALHRTLFRLAKSLALNPIIIATASGLAWRASGFAIPELGDRIIELLGKAALPGALISLGATLTTFSLRGEWGVLGMLTVLKLALLPLVVWVLATHVFGLAPLTATVMTFVTACPTGVNAYLFAARYEAMPGTVAGAIAVMTVVSAVTLSVLLALLTGV